MSTLQTVREQAKAAIAGGDYGLAQSLIQKILRSFPDDYETIGLLGQIHLECDRRDEARELFRGLLEVDPENLLARSSLAIIADEEGNLGEALDQFTRIFEIDITNRQIAAEIRRLNNKVDGPRRADPGYSKHALARRLLNEGLYNEAIPLFDMALETAPEPVVVALGMARALWLAGRLEEAGDVADEILASHPACIKALATRAGVALAKGDPSVSLLLEKIARLNPGNAVAKELFQEAELVLPPMGSVDPDLPEDGDLPEDVVESGGHFASEEDDGDNVEPFDLPEAEVEGEWIRERAAEDQPIPPGQQAGIHLAAASSYWSRGLLEPAVDELRAALRLDGSLVSEVKDAALAMMETAPEDSAIRWLVGDTLVLEGKLRLAMEQYMMVLSGSSKGTDSQMDKEQDGTNTGNREA